MFFHSYISFVSSETENLHVSLPKENSNLLKPAWQYTHTHTHTHTHTFRLKKSLFLFFIFKAIGCFAGIMPCFKLPFQSIMEPYFHYPKQFHEITNL
jgi:hypothetical protein